MTNWSQYSPSADDDARSGYVIRYQLRKGGNLASPVSGEGDDPGSPNFLPLDKRKEIDKARFWALHRMGQFTRQKAGIFDA